MIFVAKAISAIIILLLLSAAYISSTFYWVFLAPIPVLIVCQFVALSREVKSAERFFGFTDIAYYLIIGAVIGLGTRYLPELDRIFQEDAEITYSQAEIKIPEARSLAATARTESDKATRSLETIPPDVISECMARQMAETLAASVEIDPQRERIGSLQSNFPAGCEIPLSILDLATRAAGEAIRTNQRVTELNKVIERGPNPEIRSSDIIRSATLEWLLLRLFPALILCGVMLKIGKATLSIRKSA
jgi:hypothetical protein